MSEITGEKIYKFAEEIYPVHRSITGDGVRKTLHMLKQIVPELNIIEVPSGTKVFDWIVPDEWVIREAYLQNSSGEKIIDMKKHNLHVMSYSAPIDVTMSKSQLKESGYIYTLPENYKAIPYVTSYYKRRVGFCLSEYKWDLLPDDDYRLYIDSEFKTNGSLTYGEIVIPGDTEQEILFSTYICHPQMANNEVSGPAVAIHLAEYLKSLQSRKFTYRFVFVPETIGVITYLSQNLEHLKKHVFAGFNLTCIGDERDYSHVCSRYGNNRADVVAEKILNKIAPNHKMYSFMERGSDEREYCAPGIDLPICTLCRSKFHVYPEYHTSRDNMSVISPKGLYDSFVMLKDICEELEGNTSEYEKIEGNRFVADSDCVSAESVLYMTTVLGEPQLGKRNLYNTLGRNVPYGGSKTLLDVYFYCDGTNSTKDICDIIGAELEDVEKALAVLLANDLIKEI